MEGLRFDVRDIRQGYRRDVLLGGRLEASIRRSETSPDDGRLKQS